MEKKTYVARPGVDWVNGGRVPQNREVELTEAEARFDLAQGRIQLKGAAKPVARAAKAAPKAATASEPAQEG